ncbi:hypothetical protein Salat_1712100 [Sesamum alatum]|uniref:Uncharacterized protein n=1 Tax=Sesamum alatum TaxID=300844 RepID=A0AAE1Y7Z9_9LAMI|nr:hypothetical protein Salat_1712100 [Sesamum alatum]
MSLRLSEMEGSKLVIPDGLWSADPISHQLFLVGRLLSSRQPKFEALVASLKSMLNQDPEEDTPIQAMAASSDSFLGVLQIGRHVGTPAPHSRCWLPQARGTAIFGNFEGLRAGRSDTRADAKRTVSPAQSNSFESFIPETGVASAYETNLVLADPGTPLQAPAPTIGPQSGCVSENIAFKPELVVEEALVPVQILCTGSRGMGYLHRRGQRRASRATRRMCSNHKRGWPTSLVDFGVGLFQDLSIAPSCEALIRGRWGSSDAGSTGDRLRSSISRVTEERVSLRTELEELLARDEMLGRQRGKGRRRKNSVPRIRNRDDIWCSSEAEISDTVVEYFQGLFQLTQPSAVAIDLVLEASRRPMLPRRLGFVTSNDT